MPVHYLRALTSPGRTTENNRRLGRSLAFVAGAANAGGFLAVGQYTSHMTGIVSALADHAVLGNAVLVTAGLCSLLAFMTGAAVSAILINWGRRRGAQSEYAMPLMLEAALLLVFGLLGTQLAEHRMFFVPATVGLLCFIMGLQNAIITKISKSEIRTTHMTGVATDIGIEIGKLFYWNVQGGAPDAKVMANRPRLRLLASLLGMFLLGGVTGALGFKHMGFVATVPLATLLIVLAIVPVFDDLAALGRRF
ncbi:YoaK family protein [Bordetella bronchialis]|uniref:DUF1275 family protein n=1 Tax=Bordetella bronchialis TaxID=463025 RepID=A0A193G531_9BORD|nr:YoaK family protein [Bordetella bronchialis]ANN69420.1 hypothetical protein BAU06_04685 [Bordetella bronchialis]ANN74566.1 hypothetical protein BAU08_04655 [Bordetella bronchialis]